MNKKLVTLILTAALLIAACVQAQGTIGSRDMSGDTHISKTQVMTPLATYTASAVPVKALYLTPKPDGYSIPARKSFLLTPGTIGVRDMSGDTHARAAETAE